ncbi:hypothetical protein HBA55_28205 [Pseudomaricurvus alkylphenolicus]|uniref:GFA family protein n=1 Tax=Pseudomaricurvus alkylphenolicus TaxID=1306991 RepID=UPI001423C065|nr:hypothetical protein [Pseudomaricurvus alkylphenolicus]
MFCAYGSNEYRLTSTPIFRFICHCTVCQRYTGEPYSDVAIARKKHVKLIDISATNFSRMKLPPKITRGLCRLCGKPSMEFGIFDQLAFIP